MKVDLCDFCLGEDKVSVSTHTGKTAIRGTRLHLCLGHKKSYSKVASNEDKVLETLNIANEKANSLRGRQI